MSEQALVAKTDPHTIVPVNDTARVLEMISRVASDPSADIDKLERLMALHRQMESEQAEKAFNAAMAAAQAEMGRISADATNPQTRSKYATYGKLDKVLRPIYTKHGFALSFGTGEPPAELMVRVVCHVSHVGGHSRDYLADMPADGKGAKGNDVMTRTHAVGSAMSYGMRYLLKMIFNVAIGEEDNDGNGPRAETITEKQVADLESLITEVGANRAQFLRFLRVGSLSEVLAKDYAAAVKALEAKRKR